MVRTMAVVLRDDDGAAVVRDEEAACVSLEGTRPVDVGGAELPPPLLLLLSLSLLLLLVVAAGADVWAGASDVVAGSSEVGAGAEDAGAWLDGAGASDDAGGGDDVAGAAEEATELPPVPEACRFSLWWRYSLMPSMCRPSRLKADAIATKARSVTNNHAWRIMVMSGEETRVCGSGGNDGWVWIYLLGADAFPVDGLCCD